MQKYIIYTITLAFLTTLLSCGGDPGNSQDADTVIIEQPSASDSSTPDKVSVRMEVIDQIPTQLGDMGCSCSFRTAKDDYNSVILFSNMKEAAAMRLNGETVMLKGGETDSNDLYYQRSTEKDWIVMHERVEDYVFGKKIEYGKEGWEDRLKNELVHALVMMDTLPERIEIKSIGTVGMGRRGMVGDELVAALDSVRASKEELKKLYPYTFQFFNDAYEISITAYKNGVDDGGGPQFEGEMVLKTNNGKVLETRKVWGGCGC